MKSKVLVFLGVLLVPVIVWAAYNDVSLTTGTTLRTTVGASTIDLTVTNGTVESVTVNAGSLDITLAAGSNIDLTSVDKKVFSYSVNKVQASLECSSSASVLNLTLAPGQTTETVTVTPQTGTCVVPGSTGGGGSSSDSSSSSSSSSASSSSSSSSTTSTTSTTSSTPSTTTTTTTIATPAVTATTATAQTASSAAPVTTVAAPISTSVASITLTTELDPGMRNDDVITLQTLLAKDPEIYPDGTVSGFYGLKTTAAVKKFQAKYGITTVGRVGPATMAKINEVLGASTTATSATNQTSEQIQSQIQAIQNQITSLSSGAAASAGTLTTELDPGMRNDDVITLQTLLAKDSEIYPDGIVSGFYGPKTTAAVKKFQAKYGITTVGRVGPATMTKINEVLGMSNSSSSVTPIISSTDASNTTADLVKQIEDQIKAIQAQIQALQNQ